MATPLGLWLFNEASSGTSPTSIADTSAGTAVNLTPHYTGTAAWSSIAAGKGLTYGTDENSGCESATFGTNKIQTAINGSKTLTWELVIDYVGASHNSMICDIDDYSPGGAASAQAAGLWTGNGGSGNGTQFEIWSNFADPNYNFRFTPPTGVTVVHLVYDSANATAADRGRLYYNGTRQTPLAGGSPATIPQNRTLDVTTTGTVLLAHSGDVFSSKGTYYYVALYTAALTSGEITANATALASNNDADPNASGGTTFDVAPSDTITLFGYQSRTFLD